MAAIYTTKTGETITDGLQGCHTSDQAFRTAKRMADERGEAVHLSDDDGEWIVHPADAAGEREVEELA